MLICVVLFTGITLSVVYRLSKFYQTDFVYGKDDWGIRGKGGWKLIIFQRTARYDFGFSNDYKVQGQVNTERCAMWYSSKPISVYYRFSPKGGSPQSHPWHRYPDVTHFFSSGYFQYRFVRDTPGPTWVFYNHRGSISRHGGCGYRGSDDPFRKVGSSFDFFTDKAGFPRWKDRLSETQTYKTGNGTPSKFLTSNRTSDANRRRNARKKSQTSARQASAYKMPDWKEWTLISQAWGDDRNFRFSPNQLNRIHAHLKFIGFSGDLESAIYDWKITFGYKPSRRFDHRMLKKIMLTTEGQTEIGTKQTIDLPTAQWKKVQAKLNELGFSAGSVDGIPGKQTSAAIARWQRSVDKTPTGVLGMRDAYGKLR